MNKVDYIWSSISLQTILFVLVASLAFAQTPNKVNMEDIDIVYKLGGKWKFNTIDKLAYASPDYSDSSWENISVPGQWHILGISNVETVWYRRNVFIKNVFFDKPISIRVPNIADAHELYFNGVKIGGAGIISSNGGIIKKSCVPGIYQIPADIIKYDSDNLIAIRVCDDVGWGGFITTNFFAGSSKLLRINFQRHIMWYASISFVLIFLGVYYSILFMGRLKDIVYLYYSLLTLVAGFTLFGSTGLTYLIIDSFWFNHFVFHSGLNILVIFAFLFIYRYYNFEPDFIFKLFIAIFTFHFSVLLLTPLHLSILKFYGNNILTISIGLDMLAMVWIVLLLIKSAKSNRFRANIVGVGCTMCVLILANDLLGYLNILHTRRFVAEGFVILIISLSIDMALKYAKLYDALQAAQEDIIEKEKMEHELKLAAKVQRSLLPLNVPQPSMFGIDAYLKPARIVGGDFYDVIEIDNENIGILVGDVADKGIHAAMFMAVTRTLFHCEMRNSLSPAEVTMAVHRHIMDDVSSKDIFVTAFYGVLHCPTGRLTYVRAGHELPLLFRPGQPVDTITSVGRFLGMVDELDLEEYKFKLLPGDRVVLYSDGVPEAMNLTGDQFGNERFIECLENNGYLPASQIVHQIVKTTNKWTQGMDPFDDLTLLVIEAK
jgi:serine phosphatase RsbU (regulator of sigma subunit)